MVKGINYYLLLKLLKAYNSLAELYEITNNKEKFYDSLIQNKINISNNIFFSLVDNNIKIYSKRLYLDLISQNFKIISIFSSVYPVELKNSINAPFTLICYGNIELLKSCTKILYLYNEEKENVKLSILEDEVLKSNNIKRINSKYNSDINVIGAEMLVCGKFKTSYLERNKLYIFVKKKKMIPDVIAAIADILFVIRASLEENIFKISTSMLEQGKEILVTPGEIYIKNTYFSNYLLREGAQVILSRRDIKYYLSKL